VNNIEFEETLARNGFTGKDIAVSIIAWRVEETIYRFLCPACDFGFRMDILYIHWG